jgi:hypothetical protein
MSVWTTANTSHTKDPRVRVGQWGEGNWRTVVQDKPGGDWDITGPPYPTRIIAEGHVDDVLAGYFGELPGRALLAGRIEAAKKIGVSGLRDSSVPADYTVKRMLCALDGQDSTWYGEPA